MRLLLVLFVEFPVEPRFPIQTGVAPLSDYSAGLNRRVWSSRRCACDRKGVCSADENVALAEEREPVSDLLEFRLVKYVVPIAETGNFTRASERPFLAQPTRSQEMIALEEGIGVQIFVRRREGIQLTPAGQMLYRGQEIGMGGEISALGQLDCWLTAQISLPEPPLLYITTTKFSNMRQEHPLVPPQFLHT